MKLTKRENEIIKYVVAGFSDYGISRIMFIADATIKTHLRHIYRKFGIAKNRNYSPRTLLTSIILKKEIEKNDRFKNIERRFKKKTME